MTDILDRLRLSVTKGHEPSDQDAIDAITEIERLQAARKAEREMIANTAREWAEHYPQSSDGRNTFILFAEWVERPGHQ